MTGSRSSSHGAILVETLWTLLIFVCLGVSAQIGVTKFWNGKLEELQKQRLPYDGALRWKP